MTYAQPSEVQRNERQSDQPANQLAVSQGHVQIQSEIY